MLEATVNVWCTQVPLRVRVSADSQRVVHAGPVGGWDQWSHEADSGASTDQWPIAAVPGAFYPALLLQLPQQPS